MLGEERQQAILAAVEQRHSVSVQELMQLQGIKTAGQAETENDK